MGWAHSARQLLGASGYGDRVTQTNMWGFLLCSCNEIIVVYFANRYDFGCNFWNRVGRTKSYTHTELYRLAFPCLPWSPTRLKPPYGCVPETVRGILLARGPPRHRCSMPRVPPCFTPSCGAWRGDDVRLAPVKWHAAIWIIMNSGVWIKILRRRRNVGILASKAPHQGLKSSFGCWIARRRLARKECFSTQASIERNAPRGRHCAIPERAAPRCSRAPDRGAPRRGMGSSWALGPR